MRGGVVVLVDRQPRRLAPGRLGRLDVLDRQHRLPVPPRGPWIRISRARLSVDSRSSSRVRGTEVWAMTGGRYLVARTGGRPESGPLRGGVEARIPGGLDGRIGVGSPGDRRCRRAAAQARRDGISEIESGLTQGGTERGRGVVAGCGLATSPGRSPPTRRRGTPPSARRSGIGSVLIRSSCAMSSSPLRRPYAARPPDRAVNRVAASPYTSEATEGGDPRNTSGAV